MAVSLPITIKNKFVLWQKFAITIFALFDIMILPLLFTPSASKALGALIIFSGVGGWIFSKRYNRITLTEDAISFKSLTSSWKLMYEDISRVQYVGKGRYGSGFALVNKSGFSYNLIISAYFNDYMHAIQLTMHILIDKCPTALFGKHLLEWVLENKFSRYIYGDDIFIKGSELQKGFAIPKDQTLLTAEGQNITLAVKMSMQQKKNRNIAKWAMIIFLGMGGVILFDTLMNPVQKMTILSILPFLLFYFIPGDIAAYFYFKK